MFLIENRSRKAPSGKSANNLFFGVVAGFIFSFLFAYSGIMEEDVDPNYSIYDFMSKLEEKQNIPTIILI